MTKRNPNYAPRYQPTVVAARLGLSHLPSTTVWQWLQQGSCETPLGRFMRRVERQAEGCWIWTGPPNHMGYGRASWRNKVWLAHRLAYTWARGPIPEGLTLDHLCRVPACVNPDHLEPVTSSVNVQRAWAVIPRAVTCRRGHPRTPENTHYGVTSKGHRKWSCNACRREARAAA